jgi:PKD repeat protein
MKRQKKTLQYKVIKYFLLFFTFFLTFAPGAFTADNGPLFQRALYLTPRSDASINGLSFGNKDIVKYDPVTETAEVFMEGSALSLADNAILDAFAVVDYDKDGSLELLYSCQKKCNVGNLTYLSDDLLLFDPDTGQTSVVVKSQEIFKNREEINALSIVDFDNDKNWEFVVSIVGCGYINDYELVCADEPVLYDPDDGTKFKLSERHEIFRDGENYTGFDLVDINRDEKFEFVVAITGLGVIGETIITDEAMVWYDPESGQSEILFNGRDIFYKGKYENIWGLSIEQRYVIAMAQPQEVSTNENVKFSALPYDPDNADSYTWDFGDNTPVSHMQSPAHLYKNQGTYTAYVEMKDTFGDTYLDSVEIKVNSLFNKVPDVNASADKLDGVVPLTVSFSVQAQDPDGDLLSYSWDFGDGAVSNEQNPVHTYEEEGVYTATVTVDDNHGGIATAQLLIKVTGLFTGFGADTTGGLNKPLHIAANAAEFTQVINTVSKNGGDASVYLEGSWTYTKNVDLIGLKNFTINGMDADVTFENSIFTMERCENVILRGLRIRHKHALSQGDGITLDSCNKVIVDHCSISETYDGIIDIVGLRNGPSKDITISYCIFANSWKQTLVKYGGTTHVTFYRNLWFNNGLRTPQVSAGIFDLVNNVIYGWQSTGTSLENGAQMNIVNNYYRSKTKGQHAVFYRDSSSKAYIMGNVFPRKERDRSRLSEPLATPPVETVNAKAARNIVLEQAGKLPHDDYDLSIIDFVSRNRFNFPPPPVVD